MYDDDDPKPPTSLKDLERSLSSLNHYQSDILQALYEANRRPHDPDPMLGVRAHLDAIRGKLGILVVIALGWSAHAIYKLVF